MQYTAYITDHRNKIIRICTRKRFDAACLTGERMLRDLLRSLALLDRKISNDAILWIRDRKEWEAKSEFGLGDYSIHLYIDNGEKKEL